jgi:hypothetical protein
MHRLYLINLADSLQNPFPSDFWLLYHLLHPCHLSL